MEGRRVNHSWCVGIVSHSYGGFGRAEMQVMVDMHARQNQDGLLACREMP